MPISRGHLVLCGLAVVSLAGAGCRRATSTSGDLDAQRDWGAATDVGAAATAAPYAPESVGAPGASPYGDPFAPDARPLPPAEAPHDNIDIPTGTVELPGESAPSAPPPDPFDAVVQAARASAVGCFAGLPPGEYSARLDVAVTPSGRVTRVEVQNASTSDAAVLKCLEQAATRDYPSSPDGRKLAIDVRVKG